MSISENYFSGSFPTVMVPSPVEKWVTYIQILFYCGGFQSRYFLIHKWALTIRVLWKRTTLAKFTAVVSQWEQVISSSLRVDIQLSAFPSC